MVEVASRSDHLFFEPTIRWPSRHSHEQFRLRDAGAIDGPKGGLMGPYQDVPPSLGLIGDRSLMSQSVDATF